MQRTSEDCSASRSLVVASSAPALRHNANAGARDHAQGRTVVVPLHGEISPSLVLFHPARDQDGRNAGAAAIIFEMNTYGGRLDSAEEITGVLNHATIPTYTFINTNAGSAGAIIALATKHIYMAPVSAIGAAAPVLPTGEDLPPTARDKTISYWSALIRGSATRNGHNPDIGEAFMNKEKEVKIGDRVLHPKGSLLTLNAQEATEKINGKPVLAEGIADSVQDLMRKAGLKGQLVTLRSERLRTARVLDHGARAFAAARRNHRRLSRIQNSGRESARNLSPPFVLRFFSSGIISLGWRAGKSSRFSFSAWSCVLIEILFFAHSTIVFGVVGVFLMLASLLWAMIDRYPGQTFLPDRPMLAMPLRNLLLAIVAAWIVIAVLARYLPRTSIYRRFALMSANPPGPSLSGAHREFITPLAISPGMRGIAVTTLRPSGKARFADHIVDVVTEGEFIPPETPISVVEADGMRVVVKAVA